MLNTKKYLYILPDSAYLAELLPAKKPHTFAIQAFRQINGEFIDENEFIAENVEKLLKKIEPEEYHLILPDFLFTNTIVDIKHTDEASVKKYLKEELLPSLGLNKDTHEIDTFILTQHQGKSKVQLSALEKSLLIPIQKAAAEQKITITNISPLSWTIKSIISLEPSLSTIQIGSMLYLALHYIGVDQTISFKIDEAEHIVETVKTLKGAEPNIQTMYLLTNGLVENTLKEKLSGTLPIQQLSNFGDDQEGIPSYIKQIIEACAKTLDIPEQPVPKFPLGKYTGKLEEKVEAMSEMKTVDGKNLDEKELPAPTLPAPTPMLAEPEEEPKLEAPLPMLKKVTLDDDDEDDIITNPAIVTEPTMDAPKIPATPEPVKPAPAAIEPITAPATLPVTPTPVVVPTPLITPAPSSSPTPNVVPFTYPQTQPAPAVASTAQPMTNSTFTPPSFTAPTAQPSFPSLGNQEKPRVVIKNKSGAGSLVKVVAITLGALILTVAVGVGIGFGLLSISEKKNTALTTPKPVVVENTATPTPLSTPTPALTASTASASASTAKIAKDKTKILIVNATTISGKAGKVKSTLAAAGWKSIKTGNATDTYPTPGTYVLLDQPNPTLVATLSKDSKITMTYQSNKDTEDPKGAYDVVIVLAQ